MATTGRRDPQELTRQILRYLIDHPDAKDTIEGILKWWLAKNWTEVSDEEVKKCLDLLVLKGWVTKRQTTRAQIVYGVNKERLDEIGHLLSGSDKSKKADPNP